MVTDLTRMCKLLVGLPESCSISSSSRSIIDEPVEPEHKIAESRRSVSGGTTGRLHAQDVQLSSSTLIAPPPWPTLSLQGLDRFGWASDLHVSRMPPTRRGKGSARPEVH